MAHEEPRRRLISLVPLATVTHSETVPRRYRDGWVGNQGAKAECGHMAGSVVEGNSRHPQIRRLNHWFHLEAILRPVLPPQFKN
jgi:hypothetical protein